MKKPLSLAVALAFVMGIAGLAAAQTSTTTTTPPATEKKTDAKMDKAAKAGTTKLAIGAVKSTAADSVVVAGKEKGQDKEWTFAVDANTKVKKAGKDVPAAELKAGDKVQVRYTEADGKAKATMVNVSSASTAGKAANPCAAKTDAAKTDKKQ